MIEVQESETLKGAGVVEVREQSTAYGDHVWIEVRRASGPRLAGGLALDVRGAEGVIRALGAFVARRTIRLALTPAEIDVYAAAPDLAVATLAAEVRRLRAALEGEAEIARRGGLDGVARRLERTVEPVLRDDGPRMRVLGDPLVEAVDDAAAHLHRWTLVNPAAAELASDARIAVRKRDRAELVRVAHAARKFLGARSSRRCKAQKIVDDLSSALADEPNEGRAPEQRG